MLIIFMVSTNVILWTFSENAQYNAEVMGRHQEEAERLNEELVASEGNYSVSGNLVKVRGRLKNTGSVAVRIISLWVFDGTRQRYNSTSLDWGLNPGDVIYFSGENATVTIGGVSSADEFNSWFVTARGNTFSLEEAADVIVSQVTQGIGSVAMDFVAFRYYNVSKVGSSYVLDDFGVGGGEGYSVPADSDIAFEVLLTNFDPTSRREIQLSSGSILWAIFPLLGQQPRCAGWYIVNVHDNGTIAPDFTTVTLEYGMKTLVYFASLADMEGGSFVACSASDWYTQNEGPAAINLMLVGTIDSQIYGQNVPFVSICFEP
jgi:hypothetical protein